MKFFKFGNKIKSNIISINDNFEKEDIKIEDISKYAESKKLEIINKYKNEYK